MDGRLFGLDIQLVFDVMLLFIMLIILYIALSNLFFKPVRAFLEKRAAAIEADKEVTKTEQEAAQELKEQYESLLKEANREAEYLMSSSRKEALKRQDEIIAQAKSEASAIIEQAAEEVNLEKLAVKADVKQEMAGIASMLANQFVDSKDPFREALLLEETLKEMGDEAWVN